MEKAIVDLEKSYWSEAIELFRGDRSRDEKQTANFLKEWERPEAVKGFFENTKRRADKEYSPRFGRILEKVEVAMSVGDIAMKGAPESVGLAWMGVRMCLSTLSDDHSTFEVFGQAAMDILGIMISCAVFSKMYGPTKDVQGLDTKDLHAQVTSRIPKVYSAILDFSFSVKQYLNQHRGGMYHKISKKESILTKPERFFRGLLRSANEKFSGKIRAIQTHDEQMSKFATLASQQLVAYNQSVAHESQKLMTGFLAEIESKLEKSLQLKENQAEDLKYLREFVADMSQDLTPHKVAMKVFEQNMRELSPNDTHEVDLRSKISRRKPEQTCTWIFDQPAFQEWYDSANSAMLWISGGPGFGKSVLVAATIEELQKRSKGIENDSHIVAFFFLQPWGRVHSNVGTHSRPNFSPSLRAYEERANRNLGQSEQACSTETLRKR